MTELTETQQPAGAEPPGPPAPRHRRAGGRRPPIRVLVAAAVLVVGGVTAIVLATSGGETKKPVINAVPGAGLDVGGSQLATLLTGARDKTFHARYSVTGDEKLTGGKLELEWWNTDGRSRIDTTRTRDGEVVKTASIVDGDRGVSCQKIGGDGWLCKAIDVPAAGDPGGIVASLTAQLVGRPVNEKAGTVKGRAARCFAVSGGTEPINVCTNSDGVLLRNASADVTYEIASLDSDVPDSVFDPPATVFK